MSSRHEPDGSNPPPHPDSDSSSNMTLAAADRIEASETSREPSKAPCGDDTPIIHRYLTFDTALPPAATSLAPPGTTIPKAPDLRRLENPHAWAAHRKNLILALACVATFMAAYTAGSYSPPAAFMADDLGASRLAVLVGITTFCIGFAVSPMALAPVSEIYGRRPVLVASGILYVIFQAVCSVMPDLAGMLVSRLLVGVGAAVFSSVVGGVIADVFPKQERNTPMALFSGFVLAGTGAGPLVASVLVGTIGATNPTLAWKWTFWHQAIANACLVAFLALFLQESRASVLLTRKARALNKWYEALEAAGVCGVWADPEPEEQETDVRATDPEKKTPRDGTPPLRLRWLVREDEERASLATLITTSLLRPFHLLVAEPVVFFFSLWCAFAWAVLYLTFGSIPLALSRRRGLDIQESGYFFSAMIAGSIIATAVGILQDRLLLHPSWQPGSASKSRFWALLRRRFPAAAPESRLYFTCVTALFLPVGLFLFGFTARGGVHWFFPAAGIALATWGIFSVYLATFNYFADIYGRYASSALAAQSFCRNILGGAFPLVGGALFRNLGEERAGALLGGIATALSIIPWALVFWGESIRARSKFAISLNSP